ncbi:MAG: thiol-disulfide oxidoreductase, partial [Flavobacteriia bacterium]
KIDTNLDTIPFYKEVEKRVKAINKVKLGNLAPEIVTTSTLDNKKFDLKSYRGKYVLIDFWGIWCGPCVAEMPHVKSFLEKHKDKMEVLGVNSGDSRESVIAFLKKKGYHWQQVLNVKGTNDDNFVLKFNVSGFPTKFIIDPNGKIIKKYTGKGEDAFAYLEELMKE